MKKIAAFILVAVILALCLAACNGGDTSNNTTLPINTTTRVTMPTTIPASSFNEAFSMRGLTYSAYTFENLDSAAFVGLVTDDTLELYELGYKNDVVKMAVRTFYMSLEDYDETQKLSIKQVMEDNFAAAQELSEVSITHEIIGDFYVMRAVMTDLNRSSSLGPICEEGLLEFVTGSPATLTFTAAQDALITNDFIKR